MSIHQAAMPLCQSALSQLLIVDVQERLAAVMPTEELATTLTNINRLTQVARELDIPTIFTEQYPQGLGPTVDSVREHLPQSASATEKTSFSCCTAAGFERTLTNQSKRKQVILVGMEAHICILQSASGLLRWGYQVSLPRMLSARVILPAIKTHWSACASAAFRWPIPNPSYSSGLEIPATKSFATFRACSNRPIPYKTIPNRPTKRPILDEHRPAPPAAPARRGSVRLLCARSPRRALAQRHRQANASASAPVHRHPPPTPRPRCSPTDG